MKTWKQRLRVALLISPAFLLFYVWILVCSDGSLIRQYGMVELMALAVASSIVGAYCIALAMGTAIEMLGHKGE
jgi:hypothetical protein